MMDEQAIQREIDGYQEIQYGIMLDCHKQGCQPVHADHGVITYLDSRRAQFAGTDYGDYIADHRDNDHKINGHATTFVERVVTYGAWEE